MVHFPWFAGKSIFVFARLLGEGDYSFRYLFTSHKSGQLHVTGFGETNDVSVIAEKVGLIPVTLLIDGKGILTRQVANAELFGDEIISSVLPNAQVADFTYQVFKNSDVTFASVARRNTLDDLLSSFGKLGITVKKLFLGKAIETISATLQLPKDLQLNELAGILSHDTSDSADYKSLEALAVNNEKSEWQTSLVDMDAFTVHQKEYSNFQRTRMLLIILPCALLVILLANLLYYDHLEKEYVAVQTVLEANKTELDSISLLEGILNERAKVFGVQHGEGSIPASYFADQIGSTVPGEITLEDVDIFPVIADEETQKIIGMRYDTIMINGISQNSHALNDWIKKVNDLKWVTDVNILNYSQQSIQEGGDFEILITCR